MCFCLSSFFVFRKVLHRLFTQFTVNFNSYLLSVFLYFSVLCQFVCIRYFQLMRFEVCPLLLFRGQTQSEIQWNGAFVNSFVCCLFSFRFRVFIGIVKLQKTLKSTVLMVKTIELTISVAAEASFFRFSFFNFFLLFSRVTVTRIYLFVLMWLCLYLFNVGVSGVMLSSFTRRIQYKNNKTKYFFSFWCATFALSLFDYFAVGIIIVEVVVSVIVRSAYLFNTQVNFDFMMDR